MPKPSKVIRIDAQVWAELRGVRGLLEDTPNSVLRRVLGLPEDSAGPARLEPRVTKLPRWCATWWARCQTWSPHAKGMPFLSSTGMVVADLRPQKERLRVEASKTVAETAGLTAWDREGSEGFDSGRTVRWYAADSAMTLATSARGGCWAQLMREPRDRLVRVMLSHGIPPREGP